MTAKRQAPAPPAVRLRIHRADTSPSVIERIDPKADVLDDKLRQQINDLKPGERVLFVIERIREKEPDPPPSKQNA